MTKKDTSKKCGEIVASKDTSRQYGEILDSLSTLSDKLEFIKEQVIKECLKGVECKDVRLVALSSFQCDLLATGYLINGLFALARGSSSNSQYLSSLGSNLEFDKTDYIVFNHLRISFFF